MRVVLDTNVVISGIFFHGVPGRIVDALVDGKFMLFTTPSILEEYGRVISEVGSKQGDLMAFEWIDTLVEICHVIPDSPHLTQHSRDPHDDKFIDCAISSKADYLVTGMEI